MFLLASASNAIIVGFNVRPERPARDVAKREQVDIRLHTVIYEVSEEITQAMVGLLEPTFREKEMGRAEVRDTFRVPKFGTVAGSYVQKWCDQANFRSSSSSATTWLFTPVSSIHCAASRMT